MKIKLPFLHEITDSFSRENFKIIHDFFRQETALKMNFDFFKKDLTSSGDHVIQHGLSFIPKDVVITSVNPSTVVVTFKPESFTRESVTVNVTGSCTIRFLLGSYEEL